MGFEYIKPALGTLDLQPKESDDIWKSCPWDDIGDPRSSTPGVKFYDDFTTKPLIPTETTQIGYDDYKVFATSGSTVVPVKQINSTNYVGGVLSMIADTDAHSASIAHAYPFMRFSGDSSKDGKAWFECRLCFTSFAANHEAVFIGMAETDLWTLATGVPFSADTGAITNSAAAIGFRKVVGAPSVTGGIDTVVSDRATSFTAIGANESVVASTAAQVGTATYPAYTFVKLGFIYDPTDTVNSFKFYTDGLLNTTPYTAANLAATTNLKAGMFGFIAAVMGGSSGSSDGIYIDWIRGAQIRAL